MTMPACLPDIDQLRAIRKRCRSQWLDIPVGKRRSRPAILLECLIEDITVAIEALEELASLGEVVAFPVKSAVHHASGV